MCLWPDPCEQAAADLPGCDLVTRRPVAVGRSGEEGIGWEEGGEAP